jgi:choline dehydrogenase-like flavoprotein
MAVGRPSVLYAEGRCVGGSTVVNGGMSWRTPDRVLRRWAEQEGLLVFGERDLDPYFTAIESRLSVGLQDPETIGRDSELFRAGARARGWPVVPNRRNQLHCAGTSNCSSGCPTGAKRSMLVTSVPRALALGARLFADCRVDRIRSGDSVVMGISRSRSRAGAGAGLTVRPGREVVRSDTRPARAVWAAVGLRRLGRNLSVRRRGGDRVLRQDVTGWRGVHQASGAQVPRRGCC